MTYADKWKIAKVIGELLWKISLLILLIVIWLNIFDGLLNKDYMKAIAWLALRMVVQLNEIEEKL